jgi:hypothetical protein
MVLRMAEKTVAKMDLLSGGDAAQVLSESTLKAFE